MRTNGLISSTQMKIQLNQILLFLIQIFTAIWCLSWNCAKYAANASIKQTVRKRGKFGPRRYFAKFVRGFFCDFCGGFYTVIFRQVATFYSAYNCIHVTFKSDHILVQFREIEQSWNMSLTSVIKVNRNRDRSYR